MSEQLYRIDYKSDTKLNMYTRILLENKQLVLAEPNGRICTKHKHMMDDPGWVDQHVEQWAAAGVKCVMVDAWIGEPA